MYKQRITGVNRLLQISDQIFNCKTVLIERISEGTERGRFWDVDRLSASLYLPFLLAVDLCPALVWTKNRKLKKSVRV